MNTELRLAFDFEYAGKEFQLKEVEIFGYAVGAEPPPVDPPDDPVETEIVALRNVAVATVVGSAPTLPAKVARLKASGVGIGKLVNIAPLASSIAVDYGQPSSRNGELANITNCWAGSTMKIGEWNSPMTSLNCYWDRGGVGDGYLVDFTWSASKKVKKIFVATGGKASALTVTLKNGAQEIDAGSYTRLLDSNQHYKIGNGVAYLYVFTNPVEMSELVVDLRTTTIWLALYQIEVWAEDDGGKVEPLTTDTLRALQVDGKDVADFAPTTYGYTVQGGQAITSATSEDNVGITVLPKHYGSAYAVTFAEDGTSTKTYTVAMPPSPVKSGFMIIVR